MVCCAKKTLFYNLPFFLSPALLGSPGKDLSHELSYTSSVAYKDTFLLVGGLLCHRLRKNCLPPNQDDDDDDDEEESPLLNVHEYDPYDETLLARQELLDDDGGGGIYLAGAALIKDDEMDIGCQRRQR